MNNTRDKILKTAIELTKTSNYITITREHLAKQVGVAPTTITHHYKTMDGLRSVLLQHAVKYSVKRVISQAIINNDPFIKSVPYGVLIDAAKTMYQTTITDHADPVAQTDIKR